MSRYLHPSAPFDVGINLIQYLAQFQFFSFWAKSLDCVVRRFEQISFRPRNFSLEGAMKLRLASFCFFRLYPCLPGFDQIVSENTGHLREMCHVKEHLNSY